MSDKLPSFGAPSRDNSKPKRLLYTQPSFTLPASQGFDRNGKNKFGQTWEDIFGKPEVAAVQPALERATVEHPRSR